MSAATIAAALLAVGEVAARRAASARRARILAAAMRELPGIVVIETADGVALSKPGLRARAFGTRTTPRDVRLLAFVEDHR